MFVSPKDRFRSEMPRAIRSGLMASAAVPRAIENFRGVRADTDPAKILAELKKAHGDFKVEYDGKVSDLQAGLDDMALKVAAATMNGGGPVAGRPEDPEYSKLFASFFRRGDNGDQLREANAKGQRASIRAAMSEGSNADGGYLAPVEWDRKIVSSLRAISPFRSVAKVIPTTVNGYSTLWNARGWGSGWVGETASRPATATGTYLPITFPTGELYANPFVTQRLLDDAAIDLAQWLADQVAEEFAVQEGIAFISGDGANKPAGLLTYAPGGSNAASHPGGALGVNASGNASSLTGDGLIDTYYALPARYRANASWYMSSASMAGLSKFKDAGGNYIFREGLVAGAPSTLLGRPIVIDETMPAVAAGAFPIAFGDFASGYVINDRLGLSVLRDPYTNKPYVGFYTTKRVGGGVLDPLAIRLVKVAAS